METHGMDDEIGLPSGRRSSVGAQQADRIVDPYEVSHRVDSRPAWTRRTRLFALCRPEVSDARAVGDTHHHTSNSGDAFMAGNRLSPEECLSLRAGEEVVSSTGVPAQLSRAARLPVVADHAEGLGLM